MPTTEVLFRHGSTADLPETFALLARAAPPGGVEPSDVAVHADWLRRRSFFECVAAQPDGRYVIAEDDDGPAGYARVVRFDGMEELTELAVRRDCRGHGVGRRLLELAWPGEPSAGLGRLIVAARADKFDAFAGCGVMPVAGHWELTVRRERFLERRSHELEDARPEVHVLKPDRAVTEWNRLEPPAIAHARPWLHDFFGRDRTCLAVIDQRSGDAQALCWVSNDGDIGPAVAAESGRLVPVVLAALDRVAMIHEPDELCVHATTLAWWLLRRLVQLGFNVSSTRWTLCSVPLPGLDRYAPSRPSQVL